MREIVGDAPYQSLRAVGPVGLLQVLALVEQHERRDGVAAEPTVVIDRSFPVERRVIGVLQPALHDFVGFDRRDFERGARVDPRIGNSRVVVVPIDAVRRNLFVLGLLRHAREIGAQRGLGLHGESFGDESQVLFQNHVRKELVARRLREVGIIELRIGILEIGSVLVGVDQPFPRSVGIVRVGNLLQRPGREIGRIHHRGGRIEHVDEGRDASVGRIAVGHLLDAQRSAHLDGQRRGFRQLEIEVRTVVDPVVLERGVLVVALLLDDRALVGIA